MGEVHAHIMLFLTREVMEAFSDIAKTLTLKIV